MIVFALLAAAVLIGTPHRSSARRLARLFGEKAMSHRPPIPLLAAVSVAVLVGMVISPLAGIAIALGVWWVATRVVRPRSAVADDLSLATTWDLLAACLSSGMPVPAAIRAVAVDLPERPGRALRDTADLLAMGSDPVAAWSIAMDCQETASLARGARRTARSGAALAGVARALAANVRDRSRDAAEAKAQRAAVLITGPLALCFLPAFLCVGIAPVVLGLADVISTEI